MGMNGKNVAVLGFGESGVAAAELLLCEGARVTVLDAGAERSGGAAEAFAGRGVRFAWGAAAEAEAAAGGYDLAVLSPGIDPATPLVRGLAGRGVEVVGEFEFASGYCRCPSAAVTGSNGKTTTTALAAAVLAGCGLRAEAAGNCSPAFSAVVGRTAGLDAIVLEASSFQLETVRAFHPKVAALLNLSPNHLDRYRSMEEYREAKLRIFANQGPGDVAVVNAREEWPGLKAEVVRFSAALGGADYGLRDGRVTYRGEAVCDLRGAKLKGAHNAENAMVALAIGRAFGLEFGAMEAVVREFAPPAHRCEIVRTLGGVEWVNDSKSTSLEAMEKALVAEERPVVLIAGGKDKGFGFEPIGELVGRKCRRAVLIGEMAGRIEAAWSGRVACERAAGLAEAVAAARAAARPGDVVLFSPGTSSFDMFANFVDRGNRFRSLVNQREPDPCA
jgi:UDP-N-acetylmuramoylalanine--D-glutamate ligase